MHAFQRRALLAFVALLIASVLMGLAGYRRSFLDVALLSSPGDSQAAWRVRPGVDASVGGASSVRVLDDGRRLRMALNVASGTAYPYAEANLFFLGPDGEPVHADLTRYASVSFVATCAPQNTLSLVAPTFEEGLSRRGDPASYRAPSSFFSCSEQGSRVELDLTRMETPQWWFAHAGLPLSRQSYRLDQVPKLAIGSTFQTPRDVPLVVDVSSLTLHGRDLRWIFAPGALVLLAWAGFGLWLFRAHARALRRELQDKLQKDLPIVAYQQLSLELPLEPRRDREKAAILQAMASRYAEADLDLEAVVQAAAVNRNKVNEILKAELGFTFTGYLNKLRLTEAARLLAEKGSATVSEIAYTVGYNNASYFNKLFRQEYGCTPKAFRASLAGAPDAAQQAETSGTIASTIRMDHAARASPTYAGTSSCSPSES
ncbi:helix-turn-helix domain-containing protein [Massilia arenae]|uniref:Helix-turn-helix transcriptional regulator n=1 Tax=Massilia arenae TaxID=2603288 RepID=A0A5C7G5K5_9BURK|nr:AraC family transcriptional regulator [Massilia arenae]TXG00658.1 helix-turn-helix transcriptional regulator [Massilia arenae]